MVFLLYLIIYLRPHISPSLQWGNLAAKQQALSGTDLLKRRLLLLWQTWLNRFKAAGVMDRQKCAGIGLVILEATLKYGNNSKSHFSVRVTTSYEDTMLPATWIHSREPRMAKCLKRVSSSPIYRVRGAKDYHKG